VDPESAGLASSAAHGWVPFACGVPAARHRDGAEVTGRRGDALTMRSRLSVPDRCRVRGNYVVLRSATGHLASYEITLRLRLPREV